MLASLRYARSVAADVGDPGALRARRVVSRRHGRASLAVNARRLSVRRLSAPCAWPAVRRARPVSGDALAGVSTTPDDPSGVHLILHGIADDIAPGPVSRAFAQAPGCAAGRSTLIELPTDHSGIVGPAIDPERRSSTPATDPMTLAVVDRGRRRIAARHGFVVKPTVVQSGCSNLAAPS